MLILLVHIIIICVCLFAKMLGLSENSIGLLFVATSAITTIFCLIRAKNIDKRIKCFILVGFFLRMVLLVVDVFFARLPDTGTDDDGFYRESLRIYDSNYALFSQNLHGFFPRLLSIFYFFIGSSRLSAQYLNVLFYVISAVLFYMTLVNYGLSKRAIAVCTAIICFMPNAMLYNSILRRETIIELNVCASLLYLSKWFCSFKNKHMALAIIFLIFASLFHTAFIVGVPVVLMIIVLFDKNRRVFSFSPKRLCRLLVVLGLVSVICIGFLSTWNNKFSNFSDMSDVYAATERARGGSVYLEGYEVNNIGQFIVIAPLKLFYFLFSPVPWRIRNIMDLASFFLDSLVYIALLVAVLKRRKDSISKSHLLLFVLITFVFALGTSSSGTAIRHRFSLLPFLVISYSIVNRDNVANKNDLKRKESLINAE